MAGQEMDQSDAKTMSPLLALPGELRNRIYELVLPSEFEIDWHIQRQKERVFPSILLVSRQMWTEASSLWLSDTTFTFHQLGDLKRFLDLIGRTNAGRIRTMRESGVHSSLEYAQRRIRENEVQVLPYGLQQGVLEAKWMAEWHKFGTELVYEGPGANAFYARNSLEI